MAVRTDFSVGMLVSSPGLPTDVTTPKPVESDVPEAVLYCGTLPTVVEDGTEIPPPLPLPQGEPASTTLPLASHLAQLPDVPAAVDDTALEPLPVKFRGA